MIRPHDSPPYLPRRVREVLSAHALVRLSYFRFLPEYMRGSLRYLEYLRAYVVGEFDDELLEDIPCTTDGGLAGVVKHSPRQATLLVRCFEAPHMAAGSGRWVPVGQLRPFAPPELSDEQMRDQVE